MPLLTPRQAAKEIGVGYEEVLRLMHEGHLPYVQLPGRRSYLIRPEDIEALISDSIHGEISGTVSGTEGQNERPQVAPNKRCQTNEKTSKYSDKYVWMQQYTRRKTPV